MKANKLGAIFIVSALALAGIGISYAGFTDIITVHGSVETATVEFDISEYSGTWVYKVFGGTTPPDHEFYVDYEGLTMSELQTMFPGSTIEQISWAKAVEGTGAYDVDVEFYNLFPCIDFIADIEFTIGTIPVKFTDVTIDPDPGNQWMLDLMATGNIYALLYVEREGEHIPVVEGSQIHPGEIVTGEVHIHIPQTDIYQGESGSGTATFGIMQWNDECDGTLPPKILNLPESTAPVDLLLIRHPGTIGYGTPTNPPITPNTYFDLQLADVPDGYDVDDGEYPGWCADSTVYIYWQWYVTYLWDSRDPNLPAYAADDEQWDYVNYILNHWQDAAPGANWQEIQAAIWFFTDLNPNYQGYWTANSDLIKADALANGASFLPGTGEWLAVICDMGPGTQLSFIVVDP